MIVPSALITHFSDIERSLKFVHDRARATLSTFSDAKNFPFTGRVKTIESTAEKIETGRYSKFADLDDLVAFTIIVPSSKHEDEVRDFLKGKFDLVREKLRNESEKSPDVFRFDSPRLYCRLKPSPDAVIANPDSSVFKIIFEVQLRTAFEHAWSVATHDQAYKTNRIDWKRLRVAAQLKAVIENLDSVVTAFDAVAAATDSSPWSKLEEQIKIQEAFEGFFENGELPSALFPKDMSRFCNNIADFVAKIRPKVQLSVCLDKFKGALEKRELHPIPSSLSLFQLFVGYLIQSRTIPYTFSIPCHITEEMFALFPAVREVKPIFLYGETSKEVL
ncbi:nucleotidyltransferase family protein [Belnapia rosea]|uniref:RelA/SpoT domain-containing protein n=1 Tax=Belnapia rosea TaxID=938405 RepID=A0A1G6KN07_9PROT|nr:hypothetical protein [Belnapia rosea]SDC31716.1 hypothetical protein SAMN04487779_1001559 [Belnapia rosea]